MPNEYIESKNKSINKSIIILIIILIILNLVMLSENLHLRDKILKVNDTIYEQSYFNNRSFQNLKQDIVDIDNLIKDYTISNILLENRGVVISSPEDYINEIIYKSKDIISVKSIDIDNNMAKIQGEIK